jgi:acrosin
MDDHNLLPDPDSVSPTPIYLVITPPGVTSDQGANVGGYHINQNTDNSNFFGIPIDPDPAPMIWAGVNNINGHTLQDGFSLVFSHELAETMTNPNLSGGITVSPAPGFASAFPTGTGNEIGDNEAGFFSYGYRLGGALVQAYFESATGNFVVEDGTTNQNFTLTPQYSGNTFQGTYTLTVAGDQLASANDTITIDTSPAGGVTVTLNGYSATFDPGVISSIQVLPGGGANTVNIEHTLAGAPVTISDSNGSDVINLSPSAQFLDTIKGSVTINGDGLDTVNLADQGTSFSDTYTVTNSTVTRPFFAGLSYSGIANLTLSAETGSNVINVSSTASGVQTTVNTDGGGDTVNVEHTTGALTVNLGGSSDAVNVSPTAHFLDNIKGNVIVNGTGSNTMTVFDQSDPYGDTYTLTATSVTRTFSAVITYGGLSSVVLDGGSASDTYYVNSSNSSTPLTINAGAGNDTVYVGTGNLDNVAGAVAVNAGGGTNAVVLQDASAPFGDTYTVTSTTVTRPYFGGLAYSGVQSLTLNAESGADTINVTSTAAGCSTVINAGSGNDTVNVGSATSSLDAIQGALSLNGQAGTDVLYFNDQAAAAGHTYTFTASSLMRSGAAVMYFGTFETVNLTGTSHDDSLILSSLPAGTMMLLDLGAGNNGVYGPNTSNVWEINGYSNGGGHARLNGLYTIYGIVGLSGGTAADRFEFLKGGYIPSVINGGGGGDTLDYSQYNTAVSVNLGAYGNGTYGFATGVGSSVANIQNVLGSPFADTLIGSIYGSVLDGEAGNDTLRAYNGGSGRNVLIGGGGSDTITGGPNGDVIIGGSTSYDNLATNPNAIAGLNAIFAEWSSADTYAQRMQYLSGPTGHYNGSYFLIRSGAGQTVFDDGVNDSITAGAGSNWIIPS